MPIYGNALAAGRPAQQPVNALGSTASPGAGPQRFYPTPPFVPGNQFRDDIGAAPPDDAARRGLDFDWMGSQQQFNDWLLPRLLQRYQSGAGPVPVKPRGPSSLRVL